jgi:UDP-glucose 4-epimerase
MIYNALNSKIKMYSNRNSIRDFVFIDDVIDSILFAAISIDKLKNNYYNIGSGKGISLKDLMNKVEFIIKKNYSSNKIIKSIDNSKLKSFDYRNYTANIKKFNSETGWKPKTGINNGIIKTIDYLNINKI